MSNTATLDRPTIPTIDELMDWENGTMDLDTEIELFQRLIDCGLAFTLQGCYGRNAQRLIDAGLCTRGV